MLASSRSSESIANEDGAVRFDARNLATNDVSKAAPKSFGEMIATPKKRLDAGSHRLRTTNKSH